MASYSKVIILGNVTRDVDFKYAQSGMAIASIGVAINNRTKKGDEWVSEPTFLDVTAFGKTAEAASKFLVKGSPVLVEGKLKQENWEDREGGKRSKIVVICDRLEFIGPKAEQDSSPKDTPPSNASSEECPF